jgi:hypothetical protein
LSHLDGPLTGGACGGTIKRTYTVTDDCGNNASCDQIITVNDTIQPELHNVPGNTTVPCGGPIPGPCNAQGVTATDNCGTPTLTCRQDISAHGATEAYFVTNCWTATDACSNSVNQCQVITVQACGGANICVVKFYDANADGLQNNGEVGIAGWKFTLTGGPNNVTLTGFTGADGTFCFNNIPPGNYTVTESMPSQSTWVSITPRTQSVTLGSTSVTRKFGNVCFGPGGADGTPGFWRSPNGQNLINDAPNGAAPELAMLTALNLRNANGTEFDPPSYPKLREWMQGGNAVNAAYSLSVHFACVKLNLESGRTADANALIYAPGTTSANAQGFAPLNDVMNEANELLGHFGSIPSGHAERAHALALKNALATAASGNGFVQSSPCPHTF